MIAERLMVGSEFDRFESRSNGLRLVDGGRAHPGFGGSFEPSDCMSEVNSPLWRGPAFRLGGWSSWSEDGGHVEDDESNLIYMRARYYDPTSGRFLSEDPQMQGINWFVYCSSDPTGLCDESGKSAEEIESILKELRGKGEISKEFYKWFMDRSTGLRKQIHGEIAEYYKGKNSMPREELKELLREWNKWYRPGDADLSIDEVIIEVDIADESGADGLL